MIRFEHVTKTYRGNSRPGLSDVDFEVQRGEFVFLVGPSGSGKSTCLRLILREDTPSKGRVVVLGRETRSLPNRKVPYFRRHIGAVFQDFRLLPSKTVFQNVAFTLQVTGASRGFVQQAVPEALALVGLSGKEKRMPHELSGGEQQRVAIARAIVNRPQVLLADEPTGNLDPATSIEIMQLFARINAGGTTVLMATHEAGFVNQMRRRVIELAAGEVIRDETSSGYGDTSQLPTLEPEKVKGAEAIAALTAVLELQQRVTEEGDTSAAVREGLPSSDIDEARRRAAAAAAARTVASDAPSGAAPAGAEQQQGEADVAEAAARATERWRDGSVEATDPPVDNARPKRTLTGPVEIELPELPEVGVADRLGLVGRDDDETVGPTS